MKRIGAGKYPVGAYLPTEMELCRHYGISRHTVREALRQLRDAGLSIGLVSNGIRDLTEFVAHHRLDDGCPSLRTGSCVALL